MCSLLASTQSPSSSMVGASRSFFRAVRYIRSPWPREALRESMTRMRPSGYLARTLSAAMQADW